MAIIVRKLTLFSVLPQHELMAQLDGGFIANPSDREELRRQWERASRFYAECDTGTRSFLSPDDIRPLEGGDTKRAESLIRRVRTYPPYDTHTTDAYNARISKLVTPQIVVNPSRAERRADVKPGMTPIELFELSFKPRGQPETIVRQMLGVGPNGGAVLFTSYDEDIRLHHPPVYRTLAINEKDESSPAFESVCLPVGGGLPFASAYRIQCAPNMIRLVLNNGIHRAYQLAHAGYEWCPLLVTDLIPLELPEIFVNLPRGFLLDPNSNPPLITDFLNNDLIIPLDYHGVLKTIRFNWNFEQYATVLR